MSKTCIPDLSVTHWFRLHRNTHFWMEVRFFFFFSFLRESFFSFPCTQAWITWKPPPPPGMHFILVQHSAITPSLHTENWLHKLYRVTHLLCTPAVPDSDAFQTHRCRQIYKPGTRDPGVHLYYKLQLVLFFFNSKITRPRSCELLLTHN